MDLYAEITKKIIFAQKAILGPVAVSIATKTPGLDMHDANHPSFSSDPKEVLVQLVKNYSEFFGDISIEVCKEAAHDALKQGESIDLPDVLK